jgi:hypothetical protein
MPSLSTTRVTAAQEEPDTGEEAAVAAAIRLPEWVHTNLRRLAVGESPLPSGHVATIGQNRCCDIVSTDGSGKGRI